MNDQANMETFSDADCINLEASNCSIELIRNAGAWPAGLDILGALSVEALQQTLSQIADADLRENKFEMSKSKPHINIVLSSNAYVQKLNKEFRGKDKPTNVLSFPTGDDSAFGAMAGEMIGDIILAYETVCAEADEQSIPINHHFAHLVVHGALHLLGLDHQQDDEAREMEELETVILSRMKIANPYGKSEPIGNLSQMANGEYGE